MKKGLLVGLAGMLLGVTFTVLYFKASFFMSYFEPEKKSAVKKIGVTTELVIPKGRERPKELVLDIPISLERAKMALDTLDAGYQVKKEISWGWKNKKKKVKWFKTTYSLGEVTTLLAVTHEQGGPIQVIKVTPHGSFPKGFTVDQGMGNGVGTPYSVSYPEGYVLLRIKRAITLPNGKFREVQYSPYSKELDVPEVREAGARYVEGVVDSALVLLRSRGVGSQAFSHRLIADFIPRDVAVSLALIEHIDPARFLVATKAGDTAIDSLINRELVILGLNGSDSYRYAVSKAGARGMFQFIPRTYTQLRVQYPSAKLGYDFVLGMNDHYNGAIASFCLFDCDLARVDPAKRMVVVRNPLLLGQYLAAAYNGGSHGAKIALVGNGFATSRLKYEETRVYVKKFQKVWGTLYPRRRPIALALSTG